jgi:phosphatidylinositol glycan class H protein
MVRKSNGKGFFVFFSALIVLANASYLFLVKVKD